MGNNRGTLVFGAAVIAAANLVAPAFGHAEARALTSAETGSAEANSQDFFTWARPSNAVRVERTIHIGKAPMVRTHGVRMFVPAQEGLTAAYLTQVIETHVQKGTQQPSATDPFAVRKLQVEVRRAGNGFFVKLTSDDLSSAQEVLKRVQARVGG